MNRSKTRETNFSNLTNYYFIKMTVDLVSLMVDVFETKTVNFIQQNAVLYSKGWF